MNYIIEDKSIPMSLLLLENFHGYLFLRCSFYPEFLSLAFTEGVTDFKKGLLHSCVFYLTLLPQI